MSALACASVVAVVVYRLLLPCCSVVRLMLLLPSYNGPLIMINTLVSTSALQAMQLVLQLLMLLAMCHM